MRKKTIISRPFNHAIYYALEAAERDAPESRLQRLVRKELSRSRLRAKGIRT